MRTSHQYFTKIKQKRNTGETQNEDNKSYLIMQYSQVGISTRFKFGNKKTIFQCPSNKFRSSNWKETYRRRKSPLEMIPFFNNNKT